MNRTERKVRFGLTDAVIILLVLACVALAVWYFAADSLFDGGDDVKATYVVRFTDVRIEMISHIKVGDSAYDGVYGNYIGKVSDVSIEQHTEQVLNKSTGEPVNAVKSGYFNVYVKISADAKYKDNTYYLADTELRVGESMYVNLPDFSGAGYCTEFSVVGEEG